MNRIYTAIAALILCTAVWSVSQNKSHDPHKHAQEQKQTNEKEFYRCPMHPSYNSEKPGSCPICGMDLVKTQPQASHEDPGGHKMVEGQARVKINARRRQLIGVKTVEAKKMKLTKIIRSVGRIAYDPELYRTQEEYLAAVSASRQIEKSESQGSKLRAKSLIESSHLKLRLLGVSDAQIKKLERTGKPDRGLLLGAGSDGNLWLYVDVYESELAFVKKGQTIEARSASIAGEVFTGRVTAIDPILNPNTRTARVRAEIKDPKELLRQDMFLNSRIHINIGNKLAVPKESITDTGARTILFVDEGNGYLSPRVVKLSERAEHFVVVKEGVKAGERVVVSGNFLIDSESKLQSALSAFSAGGHDH